MYKNIDRRSNVRYQNFSSAFLLIQYTWICAVRQIYRNAACPRRDMAFSANICPFSVSLKSMALIRLI